MRRLRTLLSLFALPAAAWAQTTLYWDADGAAAGLYQGDGYWSSSATYWSTTTAGDTTPQGWTADSIAHFNYSGLIQPFVVTLGEDVTAAGIAVGYTPNQITFSGDGHTLTLTGGAEIGANSVGGVTIDAVIAGSDGLVKTGTYDLTLLGANTYTGLTSISGGADLRIANASGLGATGASNGTEIGGTGQLRFISELTTGESFVIKDNSSILIDSAAELQHVTLTGPIVLQSDATLSGDGSDGSELRVTGVISESGGSYGFVADGLTRLSGANTFTGVISTGDSGGLLVSTFNDNGVAGALGAGSGLNLGYISEGYMSGKVTYDGATASSNRTINVVGEVGTINVSNAATSLTLTGIIGNAATSSASHDLEKDGPGTLILRGDNTFDGEAVLTNGTLIAGHNNALGTNYVDVGYNAHYDSNLSLLLENGVTLGIGVDVGNGNNDGGSTTLGLVGSGSATFGGEVYIERGIAVNAGTGGTINFTDYVSDGNGGGSLTKTGAGTAVFSGGIDLRAGGFNVNGGKVVLNDTANIVLTRGLNVNSSGSVVLGNAAAGTLTVPILRFGGGNWNWKLAGLSTSDTAKFDRILVNTGFPEGMNNNYLEIESGSTLTADLSLLGISSRPTNGNAALNDPFWQSSQAWKIVAFTGSGSTDRTPGELNPFTLTNGIWAGGVFDTFVGGGAADFAGFTAGDIYLRFTPVPEPSTWLLLGLGGTLAGLLRRRRRA